MVDITSLQVYKSFYNWRAPFCAHLGVDMIEH